MADEPKASRPLPVPTQTTQPFWDGTKEHKLRFQRCRTDATVVFYPRVICPTCGKNEFDWIDASGKGTIYSFTIVHRAPSDAFKGKTPYAVAIVETDEKVRMVSNIRTGDLDGLRIGQRVRVVFEDVDEKFALPEFELDG